MKSGKKERKSGKKTGKKAENKEKNRKRKAKKIAAAEERHFSNGVQGGILPFENVKKGDHSR